MNRMTKLTMAISAAALAVGGVAYAQMPDGHPKMDTNGDGVITRAEAQAHAEQMFDRLDVNHDGKLDQTDRQEMREKMRAMMFDKLDANHDGSISKAEFMAARPMGHDGMRGDKGHRMADGDDGPGMDGHKMGGHRMGGGHGWKHRGHGEGMMKMADTNGDGAISKSEFMAAAMKRFDTMDANHDGQVTKAERQAAREAMKARWEARKAEAKDNS